MQKFKRTKLKWRNRWYQQELRLTVRLHHQKTQFDIAETSKKYTNKWYNCLKMKKLLAVFLSLSFLGLLFFSLFQINSVSGDAMTLALKSRQTLLFWKLGASNLKRGDIVLYKPKNQNNNPNAFEMDYLGRVVGLPTESVRIENGNLYIDNNIEKFRVEEEYLNPDTLTKAYEEGKWTKIGEFEYLILTDKRENIISIPSRIIHRNDIRGILIWKF